MCAGGFRGPKSSNRIELSQFVQELLHFSYFVVLMWSPHPRGPHIIPVIPTPSPSSPHHPHHLHIVFTPPWLWSPCCLHGLHSMLSPHGPCHPHCPHHPHIILVVPTSSRRSPHHLQHPDTNYTHPHPPELVKFQFSRFELIEIFQFCLKI